MSLLDVLQDGIITQDHSDTLTLLVHVGCLTFAFYWTKYAGSDAVDWALTPSAEK